MTASRADRLLAAPAVAAAREALASAGEAWIVGGAIRDALAGRPVVDLDLVVAGDPARAARQISGAVRGPAFELSTEHRTWRALDGERAWHVDVAALRGASIADDLGERDFTANAIAVPLADPTGPTTDPFGGERDLAAGLLRAVSVAQLQRRSPADPAGGTARVDARPRAGSRDAAPGPRIRRPRGRARR